MRLLPGARRSQQRISATEYTPFSRSTAPYAQDEPSRHDEAMLGAPTIPADPFVVWLEKREADELLKREADSLLGRT